MRPRRSRRGASLAGVIFSMLVIVTVVGGVLWWFALAKSGSAADEDMLTTTVARSEFVHYVTETGEVDSLKNVDIRCEVKAKGSSGSTILEVIPEGTYVKAGDFLARLDASAMEQEELGQEIVVNTSEAAEAQARANLEKARISKTEYIEGTYIQDRQKVLTEMFVAEENLRRAEQYLLYSKRLAAKGYVTSLQLEADAFAVEKTKGELKAAKTSLRVLDVYTRKKNLTELEANIVSAVAKLKSEESSHKLDVTKLEDLREQLKKCVVTAPSDGQVKYVNQRSRRGGQDVIIEPGLQVRQGQVIIRLPDPSQMIVDTQINEAQVEQVKGGMPTVILVDAMPDAEFVGEVIRVNEYPEPSGWFSSNVKEYGTKVSIDGRHDDLRPGLTAKVSIEVARMPDVLQVPVQAVVEHGGKHYCLLPGRKQMELREIEIPKGGSNDKMVVVATGLVEGDVVATNARRHRDKVTWPKLDPKKEKARRAKAAQERRKQSDQGGPKKPGGGGNPMAALDANGDGKIGKEEMAAIPEAFRSKLLAADANGDGAIDAGEMAKAIEKLRSAGGGGGAAGGGGSGGGS